MKHCLYINVFLFAFILNVACEEDKTSNNTVSSEAISPKIEESTLAENSDEKLKKSNDENVQSLSWPQSCYSQEAIDIKNITKYKGKDILYSQLSLADRFEFSQIQVRNYLAQKEYIMNLLARFKMSGDKLDLSSDAMVGSLEEIIEKKINISEAEAKKFFKENQKGFPPNSNFKTMKSAIINLMKNQKKNSILKSVKDEVNSLKGVYSYIEPPCLPKLYLKTQGADSVVQGKNQIVYKGGFFCKECRVFWPKLHRVIKRNSAKIEFDFIPHMSKNTNSVEMYISQAVQCVKLENKSQGYLDALKIAFTTPIQYKNDLSSTQRYLNERFVTGLELITKEKLNSCIKSQQIKDFIDHSKRISKSLAKTNLLFVNDRQFIHKDDLVQELNLVLDYSK